jgi:hypothetical protein
MIATIDRVADRMRRGPRLEAGDFSEETRHAKGGPNLQVVRVAVFNARDSGGEVATARDVVPFLEAFDAEGKRVAHTRGSWGVDFRGTAPPTVTFRPTREDHPLELVAKFPDADAAWLAGAVEPQLPRGLYTIRASLRGDGLRKPATFEWRLVNPGPGGRLALAAPQGPWPELPLPAEEELDETDGLDASELKRHPPVMPPVAPPSSIREPRKPESFNSVVGELVMEGRELMDVLLKARRQPTNNPLGIIPAVGEVGRRARAWNERVAQVVDESDLPFKDKMELAIYRDSPLLIGGLSAERIGELIDNNMRVLGRLRSR